MSKLIVLALLSTVAAGCTQSTNGLIPPKEVEWEAIVALENQAKALSQTTGCSGVAQCRTAPVGNRACGGPRYYIAYCALSTDSVALFKKLAEVSAAEDAYNKRHGVVSTCEFRMPGTLTLTGGQCQTATP